MEEGRLDLDAFRPGRPYIDAPRSRQHLLERVDSDRLDFPPGSGWAYSNTGYMFVREAIEEATGQSLAVALRELVLEPLQALSARLATTPSDFQDVYWPAVRTYDPRWVYHGCLIGTSADAARVLHALRERRGGVGKVIGGVDAVWAAAGVTDRPAGIPHPARHQPEAIAAGGPGPTR